VREIEHLGKLIGDEEWAINGEGREQACLLLPSENDLQSHLFYYL
jgi:hypothetical protein